VLASYLDRGPLQQLRQPTRSPAGRRTPGLRLDDPRLRAVLPARTAFVRLVGQGGFRPAGLLAAVQRGPGNPASKLSQFRYHLARLRGKGLLARLPGTQRYQRAAEGYRLAVWYQQRYPKLYGPWTAATLAPVASANLLLNSRTAPLDRLYQ